MKIENSFEVPASSEAAWDLLMDVPRVIPCMPGAQLTETVDDTHWKAKLAVKLGPIALTFDADVKREDVDESARRAVLSARAREARGRGQARATIASSLAQLDGGTRVDIVTDLALTGAVAQYGRGMIHSVSSQLVADFAACLQAQLVATPEEAEAATAAQPTELRGLRVGTRALASSVAPRVKGLRWSRVQATLRRARDKFKQKTRRG
jgi:uncharacterized protein